MSNSVTFSILYVAGIMTVSTFAFPELGSWEVKYTNKTEASFKFSKSLYAGSEIFINIGCTSAPEDNNLQLIIMYNIYKFSCWNDYLLLSDNPQVDNYTREVLPLPRSERSECKRQIFLDEHQPKAQPIKRSATEGEKKEEVPETVKNADSLTSVPAQAPAPPNLPTGTKGEKKGKVWSVEEDGLYVLRIQIENANKLHQQLFTISIEVKMPGPHGYLSAGDWPLLPFYGAMCLIYVVFGLAWLAVSFCHWRDLLRVQFWIGAVILLGMLEKATFYAEYQNLNSTGKSVGAAVLLAELVSCAKRTLARMLVIIVSLGFGIVKPRLGPALHRVVLAGTLYMLLATVESYLRVSHIRDESSSRQLLLASVPLAVLDSAICWWIFSSLAQTTRTLRLRRNLVKLSLYRHFTNTLMFAVISSLIFMLYSIRYHRLASCLSDWKALWLDDAYWHLLFSLLLLVIMILWRPGNNNQRYAFSPLLDAPEDEDEDEDDDQFVNDAFGVKMRGLNRSASPKPSKSTNTTEDALKWVEENIPSSMPDTGLPVLDSDEEIMTTKFEVSKMQ